MPNLLLAWPKLCAFKTVQGYRAVYLLSLWSKDILGKRISEQAIPFLSVEDANKIVDTMIRGWSDPANIAWAQELKRAINS